jgi:undecaprenyl-diphosphatase
VKKDPLDERLFRDINRFAVHTPWLHGIAVAYAKWGPGLFGLFLVGGWWLARSRSAKAVAASIWAGIGTVVAVGLNQPLVHAVHRVRPYQSLAGVEVLVHRSHDLSFPSDHAVVAGAATAGLWLFTRRLAWISTVAALLLAFARVYVGAHYPGDVAAGLLLGAAVVILGWVMLRIPATVAASWLRGSRAWPFAATAKTVKRRPMVPILSRGKHRPSTLGPPSPRN